MTAIALEDHEEIDRLLKSDVDVNETNKAGCTALMWAAMRKDEVTIDRLLLAGAVVDQTDAVGRTAHMIAVRTDSLHRPFSSAQAAFQFGASVLCFDIGDLSRVGAERLRNRCCVICRRLQIPSNICLRSSDHSCNCPLAGHRVQLLSSLSNASCADP